jgi:hypothetical protein
MSDEATANMIAEGQIADPKGSLGSFELPCGWIDDEGNILDQVVVREFSGGEEDILASDKMDSRSKMETVLVNCIQSIGNIRDKERIVKIAPELTVGDRVFLLLAIRRTTLGDKYPYIETCPECNKRDLYVVDLDELAVRKMPKPEQRIYECKLPKSGLDVRWHVMTGHREAKISNMPVIHRKNDSVTLAILARIELIGEKPAGVHQIKSLSLADRNTLRDMFEEHEGGVDMSTDFECSKCGHEWSRDVSVTQQGFFFPSAALRAWKRKSTS